MDERERIEDELEHCRSGIKEFEKRNAVYDQEVQDEEAAGRKEQAAWRTASENSQVYDNKIQEMHKSLVRLREKKRRLTANPQP